MLAKTNRRRKGADDRPRQQYQTLVEIKGRVWAQDQERKYTQRNLIVIPNYSLRRVPLKC